MPKYRITGTCERLLAVDFSYTVDADTEEQGREWAYEAPFYNPPGFKWCNVEDAHELDNYTDDKVEIDNVELVKDDDKPTETNNDEAAAQ